MGISAEYLAGIFDGEGCLYIRESYRPSIQLVSRRSVLRASIVIANTHLPMLQAIQGTWGGQITARARKYHSSGKGKQQWELHWNDQNKIAALLEAMRPFLIVKAAQVELFITDFVPTLRTPNGGRTLTDMEYSKRQRVKQQMQELKREEFPVDSAVTVN